MYIFILFVLFYEKKSTLYFHTVLYFCSQFSGMIGDCSTRPVLLAPVDEVKASAGRPLIIPVCQVFQATQNLTLSITLPFGEPVGEDFWLRLDSSTQTLYGIPLQVSI